MWGSRDFHMLWECGLCSPRSTKNCLGKDEDRDPKKQSTVRKNTLSPFRQLVNFVQCPQVDRIYFLIHAYIHTYINTVGFLAYEMLLFPAA